MADLPHKCCRDDVPCSNCPKTDWTGELVVWVDKWGCTHSMPIKHAATRLREFHNAWPGGLAEIEAALKVARGVLGTVHRFKCWRCGAGNLERIDGVKGPEHG